jgi:hypothetical protein
MHHLTASTSEACSLPEQPVEAVQYLGIVTYGDRRMAAYETADGFAILRPISAMGLEARRELLVPLSCARSLARRR